MNEKLLAALGIVLTEAILISSTHPTEGPVMELFDQKTLFSARDYLEEVYFTEAEN